MYTLTQKVRKEAVFPYEARDLRHYDCRLDATITAGPGRSHGQRQLLIEFHGIRGLMGQAEGTPLTMPSTYRATPGASGRVSEFAAAKGSALTRPGPSSHPVDADLAQVVAIMLEEICAEPQRYLPPRPVRLGATWEVTKEAFLLLWAGRAMRLRPADPVIACKLAGVSDDAGGPVATIELSLSTQVRAAAQGAGNMKVLGSYAMTFQLAGKLRYNVKTGGIVSHIIEVKSIEPDREGIKFTVDTHLTKAETGT
jgi:hypothetical protein